jgi:phosphoribosylpyrophosphate synthetase
MFYPIPAHRHVRQTSSVNACTIATAVRSGCLTDSTAAAVLTCCTAIMLAASNLEHIREAYISQMKIDDTVSVRNPFE